MKQNIITPLDRCEPVVGIWLSALQDTRQRTLNSLEGLNDQLINWLPSGSTNSIGTLLYHVAAVEMSWLHEEILEGKPFPPEIDALMKYDVREQEGRLTSVITEPLDAHLERLMKCRLAFLVALQDMSVDEFRRPRRMENYEVTPEWVVHHLMQHEAEHRGQIGEIRGTAERALGKAE